MRPHSEVFDVPHIHVHTPRRAVLDLLLILAACAASLLAFRQVGAKAAAWGGWWILFVSILYLCPIIRSGRQSRPVHPDRLKSRSEAVLYHRRVMNVFTALMLSGVIGIEIAVRKAGGLWGNPSVVAFHLALVVLAVGLFVAIRFWMHGLRKPVQHRKLVYVFFSLYAFVFMTGTWLITTRFPVS